MIDLSSLSLSLYVRVQWSGVKLYTGSADGKGWGFLPQPTLFNYAALLSHGVVADMDYLHQACVEYCQPEAIAQRKAEQARAEIKNKLRVVR